MNESVATTKKADAKKGFSSTHRSEEGTRRAQTEPERQLGSLGAVISTIRSDGGMPSVESIATRLSSMHTAQRAPALLALQQTHGNQYVQRVVAGIQAKLVIGQPGDKYEQEADRVADAVMRMPEPGVQRQVEPEREEEEIQAKPLAEEITPRVQRQVEPKEEEEEEEEEIQTKLLPSQTLEVVSDVETRINSIRGGGQPLPESTQAFFEPRFGQDFSHVRLHTDTRAAESARAVNARAFTMGRDVVFGAGQYAPGTGMGRRLMAHELTHVVQQAEGDTPAQVIQLRPLDDIRRESSRTLPQGPFLDLQIACLLDADGCSLSPAPLRGLNIKCCKKTKYTGTDVILSDLVCQTPGMGIAQSLIRAYPNWLSVLASCPCTKDAAVAANFSLDRNPDLSKYHPGAAACYRSDSVASVSGTEHRQQCCYAGDGDLITSGSGAGTPDVWAELFRHLRIDVQPFNEFNRNWKIYNRFWVPNRGSGCPETATPTGTD